MWVSTKDVKNIKFWSVCHQFSNSIYFILSMFKKYIVYNDSRMTIAEPYRLFFMGFYCFQTDSEMLAILVQCGKTTRFYIRVPKIGNILFLVCVCTIKNLYRWLIASVMGVPHKKNG